jgi:phosphoglycolate phosphatase-like HAD superfamily hydrolase
VKSRSLFAAFENEDISKVTSVFSETPFQAKHPDAAYASTVYTMRIRNSSRPKMIVFDKDGTLGDCTGSIRRWVFSMADHARQVLAGTESGCDTEAILQELYDDLGWNTAIDSVNPSAPVAAGTWGGAVKIVHDFLMRHKDKCKTNVTTEAVQYWHHQMGDLHGLDEPLIKNLRGMIQECHSLGYLVGVCTSDDKSATAVALKSWGIDDLINATICGDEVKEGKPSPLPLIELCNQINYFLKDEGLLEDPADEIYTHDCIIVGDTTADTGMAKAANAGFCVGVLTGSGTTEQLLESGAHLVVPNVGYIPALLKAFQDGLADPLNFQ